MRQWRNGAGNAPRHYAGTRSATGCALSRTRSLTAAAIAVAMMATVAVTSLLPTYNAKADESGLKDGSTCTPSSIGLGDDTSVTGSDTGVATYVGGDMYVGGKPSDANDLNNSTGPTGTYAVEAEGLTVVNGSLAMNPQKEAWKLWNVGTAGGSSYVSRGFRWGVVGFGSQFRPADGKTVLAVGGNTSTSVMNSEVGAWTAPGWLGKTSSSDTDHGYKASLAAGATQVWGKTGVDSIRGLSGNDTTTSQPPVLGVDSNLVTWNQGNLSSVNGTDYSKYGEKISKLSADLNTGTKLPATGTVTTSTAPSAGSSYTIYKYDYKKNGDKGNSFTFYDKLEKEKLITFTSADASKNMQVFNLPASYLDLNGTDYTGVDFKFVNVPDNASVVVNVTGASGQTIDFHNGWRFWWNNDNIANDFVTAASGDTTQAAKNTNYAKRAQQIMWNFADASNVVIRGGQATGWIQVTDHNTNTSTNHGAWGSAHDMRATDDPSAAWMGSILVPNGSLQSHVSTNGRVWVGGDFEMLNNETVKRVAGQSTDGHNVGDEFVNESGEKTTSILDMDQERHNLPWNGSYSTSCAAIAWDKVDESGNALGGTSWTVYGKKEDAVNGTNALATIADGGWNDDADAEGSFQLGNLAKNGTYFLKESGTAEGYAQNTNIYQINTGNSTTEAATTIANVFDSAGSAISTDADKLLTDGKIINKKTGSAIEWQKVDGTDNSTLLAGSTWTLSKMNGNTAEQSWNITDDQSGTEVKSITITDASGNVVASDTTITFEGNNSQTFTATAYDQQNQVITGVKLTWSSNNATVASVDQNGTVTPTGNGDATITVKSADGKVTASFTVNVSGVTVETSVSINGYTNGQEINLEKGETLNLTAIAKPEGNTVEWSTSSPDNVSLSAKTGTSVTLTANKVTSLSVTITAKETRTNKTVTLGVNVTKPPATTTTVFFKMQDDFNQNNGQKLFLEWKTATGNWPSDSGDPPNRKEMTVASGCNGYVSYTINEVMPTSASFRIRRDKANWTTPQSFYRPDANSGFAFNGGDIVTLNTATEILGTAPSGCAVISTAAYSSRRVTSRSGEHRAVSAVLRAQGSVLNAVNETVSTKVDEDTAAGKFKVSDLANGTYQLKEKAAPNGYEVSDTVYTITIANGTATWSPAFGADNTGNKIANTRKTGSVTWTKVSSDSNNANPLPGSQWTLKQTKTFSWADGAAKYTVVTSGATLGTVTDCVDGQNGVAKCSAQTGEYVDLDGASGKFKISGLVWGEYQLIESKAPDGYDLDATPHKFRIGPLEGDNIAGNWYANTDFNTEGTSAYNEQTTFTVNGGNIKNKPGVILPGTGGAGDYWIYAAALVAALIGVVAAGMALKVRRRQ